MGFFRKLWDKIKYGDYGEFIDDLDDDYVDAAKMEEVLLKHNEVNMHDGTQRVKYIRHCFEEAAEAAKEIDKLTYEYSLVTSYLTDMEEIDALPDKSKIEQYAKRLSDLAKERNKHRDHIYAMPEAQFNQMEQMEGDIKEACKKLQDTENYLSLIKQDLNRLEGEKHAYKYRKHELITAMQNAKGMTMICACAVLVTLVMLLVLQYGLGMDTQIGYIITIGAAAIAITWLYVRYSDSSRELKKLEKQTNRLILLQNTVKIRYVNTVNLLDYLCMKYRVSNARELQVMWEKYEVEKAERQKYKEANSECVFYEEELISELSKYNVKDPGIWIHQAEALFNPKEMVEIRHGLIVRRQKLRSQMEYNRTIANNASQEVKDLVEEYPQYAKEILQIVSEYE
ncbi:MAG: hypothetical protein IJ485_01235 [Lachnospiraceae bacterium]|nr:hypothetical protein [Lachnospiraceae bacterium]